jgi:hypothetical protein
VSSFFQRQIDRHVKPEGQIKPRLPGRFEPYRITSPDINNDLHDNVNYDKQQTEDAKPKSYYIERSKPENERFAREKPAFSVFSGEPGLNADIGSQNDDAKVSQDKFTPGFSPEKRYFAEERRKDSSHGEIPKPEFTEKNATPIRIKKPVIKPIPENWIEQEHKNEAGKAHSSLTGKKEVKSAEIDNSESAEKSGNLPQVSLTAQFYKWLEKPVEQIENAKPKVETPHIIRVNIGKIEVRAITEQTPIPQIKKNGFKPILTLEDYLKQRDGGKQ